MKESDRRVLRAAARVLEANDGDWPGADQIGQEMGGLGADIVTDTLRTLQRSGYLRLDGAPAGDSSAPVFVQEITDKGRQILGSH